jgi:hypothetical protein
MNLLSVLLRLSLKKVIILFYFLEKTTNKFKNTSKNITKNNLTKNTLKLTKDKLITKNNWENKES